MKNAIFILLGYLVGVLSLMAFDAYEPEINVEPQGEVAIEGQYGAEYEIRDDKRAYEVKVAHDFIISLMAEKQAAEQKVYFYERWGIRGFVSNYYRRNTHRRSKFFDRNDVLRNKDNVYKALDEAYKKVEQAVY